MSRMLRWTVLVLLVVLGACGNPSPDLGSSEGSAALPTPVACADAVDPPQADVLAFLHCAGAELEDPRPVARQAHAADPVSRLEAAVAGLLGGPSQLEREAGYISLFSDQTALALNSVEIGADGVAIVDFADLRVAIPNASTSTGSQILLAQLSATVFQIPEVTAVEYRIHGSCATFWEWLQSMCAVIPRP